MQDVLLLNPYRRMDRRAICGHIMDQKSDLRQMDLGLLKQSIIQNQQLNRYSILI